MSLCDAIMKLLANSMLALSLVFALATVFRLISAVRIRQAMRGEGFAKRNDPRHAIMLPQTFQSSDGTDCTFPSGDPVDRGALALKILEEAVRERPSGWKSLFLGRYVVSRGAIVRSARELLGADARPRWKKAIDTKIPVA